MIITIGKYILQEWNLSSKSGDKYTRIIIDNSDNLNSSYHNFYYYIDVRKFESYWRIIMCTEDSYFGISHFNIYNQLASKAMYSSKEEAMDHVDEFLTKLSKLKVFL